MTLVIYDNDGKVISQITGGYIIPNGGVQYLEIEIPQGKRITGVDMTATPNVPIFEDVPPATVDTLQQRMAELEYNLMMNGVI